MNIDLRPVTTEDREFLIGVYEASRETELSMTPWDAAQKRIFATHQFDAQAAHYLENYPATTHDIIFCDDQPVGRLFVSRGDDQIAILDITVLAEHRNKGIATALVRDLQSEAGDSNRSLRIYIEPFNPSQKLFGELGFVVAPEDGINLRFEWRE